MGRPSPEELYLDRRDAMMQSTCSFTRITEPDVRPPIFSARYEDRPLDGWTTSFTLGLSSERNVDYADGTGPELLIEMRSLDPAWGWAIGELARQARGNRPVFAGMAIGFGAQISRESPMSAFLLVESTLSDHPLCCAGRHIFLVRALPLHADELARVRSSNAEWILDSAVDFADPKRPSFAAAR